MNIHLFKISFNNSLLSLVIPVLTVIRRGGGGGHGSNQYASTISLGLVFRSDSSIQLNLAVARDSFKETYSEGVCNL